MAVVNTLIGNIKGPKGDTGATGQTGPQGEAATINVGTVSTTAYGNPAQVVNIGTENEAILNFTIPQGAPGATVTQLDNLALNTITTATAEYPQIAIGDTGSTIFGKIVKFFQDLVGNKLDASKVANNLTTTASGYALDARQGGVVGAMFAPIEASSTASQAYAVGDYLVYNGILYRVTSAISAGATITPNTNCIANTVGGELTAIKDALTYKLAYDGTDMTAKTLPTGWSKALVWVSISATSDVFYAFHVLAASPMTQVAGYQVAQAGFTYAQITSGATTVAFDSGMYQGASYTPKRWVIWYR